MAKNPLSKTMLENEVPRVEGDDVHAVPHSVLADISTRVLGVHAVVGDVRDAQKSQDLRLEKIEGSLREISGSLKTIQGLVERVDDLEARSVEHERRLSSLEDLPRAHHDAQ
jgi:deoxyribodipyrimidine photolyase-like uncharacterized protein